MRNIGICYKLIVTIVNSNFKDKEYTTKVHGLYFVHKHINDSQAIEFHVILIIYVNNFEYKTNMRKNKGQAYGRFSKYFFGFTK